MVRGFLFVFFLLSFSAQAAEISTTVTPQSGSTADEYTFTVTVEGTSDTSRPELSSGSDFEVSYIGPQASVTIVNGSMSAVVNHLYRLYPKKTGALLTPSAQITLSGKTLTAVPLTVQVQKSKTLSLGSGASYYLEQLVDAKTVYAGQQVVNTLRLYSKEQILEANFSDLSFDRVWVEEMGKQETYRKNVGRDVYVVHELKRALYPLVAADFSLPEREIQIKVIDTSSRRSSPLSRFGLFSDNIFGFAQTTIKRLRSEPLEITVLPLPSVPPELQSAQSDSIPVGETTFSTGLNTLNINIGESKTVSFVVESTGNLHPLEKVPFPDLPDVKIYAEHPSTTYAVKNGKLVTKKTFKYSLVPLRGGTIHIPPVKLLYFDPLTESYRVAETRETSFFVKGEAPSGQTTFSESNTGQSTSPDTGAEYDEKSPAEKTLYRQKTGLFDRFSVSALATGMLIILIAAVVLFFAYRLSRLKSQKAKILHSLKTASSAEEARRLLGQYLELVQKETTSAHTDTIQKRIEQNVEDEGLQFKLLSLVDELDIMSYSNRDDVRPLPAVTAELTVNLSTLR